MSAPRPRLLEPTNDVAPRALVPGDPGRALALATALLDKPLMSNHARGLWGYTGTCLADGLPLTVQSAGVGGPSAAAVVHDLSVLGVKALVRVGTCSGARDLVHVASALPLDGTSRALGATGPVATGLRPPGTQGDVVASRDLWDAPIPGDASCGDLSTAAVLQAALVCGVLAGAVLAPAPLTDPVALGEAGLALLRSVPVAA